MIRRRFLAGTAAVASLLPARFPARPATLLILSNDRRVAAPDGVERLVLRGSYLEKLVALRLALSRPGAIATRLDAADLILLNAVLRERGLSAPRPV